MLMSSGLQEERRKRNMLKQIQIYNAWKLHQFSKRHKSLDSRSWANTKQDKPKEICAKIQKTENSNWKLKTQNSRQKRDLESIWRKTSYSKQLEWEQISHKEPRSPEKSSTTFFTCQDKSCAQNAISTENSLQKWRRKSRHSQTNKY